MTNANIENHDPYEAETLGETVPLQEGLVPAVITSTGPNVPGVSAAFFDQLAAHNSQLLDVEQSDFRGRLSLAAFAGVHPDKLASLHGGLAQALQSLNQQVTVELVDMQTTSRPRSTHVVVMLGNPVEAVDVSRVGAALAAHGANIDRIRGISEYPVTGLELSITVADAAPGGAQDLRADLAVLTKELKVDIAMERAGLLRRSKRLVCFDCDSTLITGEVIEMLAAHAGREEEVAAVTERAMRGEIDFEESLRERVQALAGLDENVIKEVADSIELTPGARTTVRTLKRMGYTVAVVSGGFNQVLEGLAEDLGLDYVRANELEIVDGKLTGKVLGKVVDRAAKAEFLREFATDQGLKMYQTVAVGDGANDIDMISAAGLGIAFNAKPALREVADTSVNHPFLDEVLYILGIPRDEIDASDSEDGTARKVALQ
ncbi:phosphoserine phosphatase SerB [Corynebacterium renale]|uniref:phosphoserine phosphatase n=1 Tax=Corynebacterium renale TaxID=1724 RepID=A0A2A9DPK0_9CORY|nr:phosphoserine phosphatase SerB [Corynebacterium renale]PFG28105.1 phosphoserine phosphatase [Corynebacterium renale]SQI20693.1 phosphoserine phosphatase [Corynebacterium renale]